MHTSLKHVKSKGFTIVELLVVIVVIGILASISIVVYNGVQQRSRDTTVLADIDNVEAEVVRYSTANGGALGSNVQWFSGGAANANIRMTPSSGNVIDIVADQSQYCIRVYNPSSNNKTAATAISKGSPDGACIALQPSVAAGGNGVDNLVGWWKLNGGGGDSSGSNFNGTLVGGVTPGIGQDGGQGSALALNGTTGFVSLGAGTNLSYPQVTVNIWAKANSATQTHVKNLIGAGNWNETTHWYLGFKNGTQLSFVYGITAASPWSLGPSYNLSSFDVTQWHLYTGTASSTQQKLYVDGVLVATVTLPHGSVVNTFDMQIGRSSYTGNFFGGMVDDARVYSRELSLSEIQTLYNLGAQ